jgi:hypothetical protein
MRFEMKFEPHAQGVAAAIAIGVKVLAREVLA